MTAWATCWLAVATALLAYFAWRAYKVASAAITTQSQDAVRANRHIRAESTMRFIYDWSEKLSTQNQALIAHLLVKKLDEGVAIRDLSDAETRLHLREMLEAVEHLSLGVRFRAYDGEIVYQLSRARLVYLWDRFQPYIDAVRRGDAAHRAQPTAFEHFEWLVQWLRKKEEKPDTPLPGSLDS